MEKPVKFSLNGEEARSLIGLGVAFLVGLLFGLVVLGWWLWPVRWKDAAPKHLRADYQRAYLQMAIEAYAQNGDAAAAKARFAALGDKAPSLLEELRTKPPKGLSRPMIDQFAQVVGSSGKAVGGAETPEATSSGTPAAAATAAAGGTGGTPAAQATPSPTGTPAAERHAKSPFVRWLGLLCGVGLAALIAVAVLFILRSRRSEQMAAVTPAQRAQAISEGLAGSDFSAEEAPPLKTMISTYVHGDSLFDESYSIEAPNGDFLGEFGLSVSETIGVGDPPRASAFELWLFDKNDIQTVTKVLMSEHTYQDEATRQRLAAKGDPVMVKPHETIVLETAALRLVAKVLEVKYGEDALPDKSYFEQLSLELSVWPKEEDAV